MYFDACELGDHGIRLVGGERLKRQADSGDKAERGKLPDGIHPLTFRLFRPSSAAALVPAFAFFALQGKWKCWPKSQYC
jgi:hypothetical protein